MNIRTKVVRTHIHTYGTDPISPPQIVVRGDNNLGRFSFFLLLLKVGYCEYSLDSNENTQHTFLL